MGKLLEGKYRVRRPIARGGQGATYLAEDLDGREVALKEIDFAGVSSWDRVNVFEREVAVLGGLTHPGIPRIIESFEAKGRLFLVQEYVDGKDLERRLAAGEQFDEARLIDLAEQVLPILAYLHAYSPPVVHRDVKPANLVQRDDGSVSLVDFGAAQGAQRGEAIIGSSGFMAPEQLMGHAVPASDVYGFGATLVRLATRKHPSDLLDGVVLKWRDYASVTPAFADWLDRLVAPTAEDRFLSATAALTGLAKVHQRGGTLQREGPRPVSVSSYRTKKDTYTVRHKGTDLRVDYHEPLIGDGTGADEDGPASSEVLRYLVSGFLLVLWSEPWIFATAVLAWIAFLVSGWPMMAHLEGDKDGLELVTRWRRRTQHIPIEQIAGVELVSGSLTIWRTDGTAVTVPGGLTVQSEAERLLRSVREWLAIVRRAR